MIWTHLGSERGEGPDHPPSPGAHLDSSSGEGTPSPGPDFDSSSGYPPPSPNSPRLRGSPVAPLYEADPTKNGLRHSRFPAPLVTPAFGFLCSYGIYYMKGRHRRARFVRIAHYTRLRIFTDANNTHRTHTNTRIFSSFLRSNRPQRPSQRARLGWVRPRAVHHRAPSCRLPDLCLADGRVSM